MTRSRDRATAAAGMLGGDVEDRPRVAPAPVAALLARVERSAARATAIAEALAPEGIGPDATPAATMRDVAETLAEQARLLREVLAWLTTGPEPEEADG